MKTVEPISISFEQAAVLYDKAAMAYYSSKGDEPYINFADSMFAYAVNAQFLGAMLFYYHQLEDAYADLVSFKLNPETFIDSDDDDYETVYADLIRYELFFAYQLFGFFEEYIDQGGKQTAIDSVALINPFVAELERYISETYGEKEVCSYRISPNPNFVQRNNR